jgi:hypothetical protein
MKFDLNRLAAPSFILSVLLIAFSAKQGPGPLPLSGKDKIPAAATRNPADCESSIPGRYSIESKAASVIKSDVHGVASAAPLGIRVACGK